MAEYDLDKIRNYLAITVLGLAVIAALIIILYLPVKTQYEQAEIEYRTLIRETILGQHPEMDVYLVDTSKPIQCQPCYGHININDLKLT